ncbi:hypothetical protein D3C87_1969020 [compost metagenome]
MRYDHIEPFRSSVFQCVGKELRLAYPQIFQQSADIFIVVAELAGKHYAVFHFYIITIHGNRQPRSWCERNTQARIL